jgi:hypothetical protein
MFLLKYLQCQQVKKKACEFFLSLGANSTKTYEKLYDQAGEATKNQSRIPNLLTWE